MKTGYFLLGSKFLGLIIQAFNSIFSLFFILKNSFFDRGYCNKAFFKSSLLSNTFTKAPFESFHVMYSGVFAEVFTFIKNLKLLLNSISLYPLFWVSFFLLLPFNFMENRCFSIGEISDEV